MTTIRPMVPGDAAALQNIHTACLQRTLAPHYTAEQIAAWLKGRTPEGYVAAMNVERIFVAETSGLVVGFTSWARDELMALFVHPDAQGRGLGSRLLDACLADAAALDAGVTRLEAAFGAENFYARRGFVATERGSFEKYGVEIGFMRMVARSSAS